jgi:putative CocE/NonD family hydrolase
MSSTGDAGRLAGSGSLDGTPSEQSGSDEYDYDPRDPVPTIWSPMLMTEPSDRRRLEHRPDILYYRSPPLTEDVEVVGHPEVVLYAASSAPDTDFFAHLVDEDPDGIALEVCYWMVRARHRNGLDREELLTPGEAVELKIKLGPTACRFVKGHRIRLEITSSNFPNHDRNHNTGGDDLAETTLVVARQTIHHSPEHPSRLELPVYPTA